MSGALSALKALMRNTHGAKVAQRVERIADEVPGAETAYDSEALRRALSQPSYAFAVIDPRDFERYAANLVASPGEAAYFRSPGNPIEKNVYGSIPRDWERVPRDAYISQLRGHLGPGRGFSDVPYLSIRELDGALSPPPMISYPKGSDSFSAYVSRQMAREKWGEDRAAGRLPPQPLVVSSHEGRHRSRALAADGRTRALVSVDAEELPVSWSSEDPDLLIDSFYRRYGATPSVRPEDAWLTRDGRFDQFPREPVPLPRLFSSGGIARKGAGALARIARSETPEFRRWFGDSKVVTPDGQPLRVYHGTQHWGRTADTGIEEFDPRLAGFRTGQRYRVPAFFFTDWADNAASYATGEGGVIYPSYLSLQSPLIVDAGGKHFNEVVRPAVTKASRAQKYDGVIVQNVVDTHRAGGEQTMRPATTYVAFQPEQIKSATGNEGSFSTSDRRLNKARGGLAALA